MAKLSASEMQSLYLSDRAKTLLNHPQGMGNYFTFKSAAKILGLDVKDLAPDGVYNVTADGYFDMGYMANHIGPSKKALAALKEASNHENVAIYPPDCSAELKKLVAKKKFQRELGEDFEVMGVEGAQGGIGYVYLTFLNPGDEVIVSDPGYFHFVPGAESSGAKIVQIPMNEGNNYRLKPSEVEAAITPKTKMIVVCDPLNPFGAIQTKEELLEIAAIARKHNVLIMNNITHNTHRVDESVKHIPMASLHSEETPMDHVVSISGTSKGYGMPGLRVGFLAGHPSILRGAFLTKMEVTKIHINYPGQQAAITAMNDLEYVKESTEILRRNFAHIEETVNETEGVTIPVKPVYGFSMVIDVSGTGVTAQEITVGMLNHKIAVTPGDGLGDLGATEYIRLNYSYPDVACVEQFRKALSAAIAEAKTGMYAEGVVAFYEGIGSDRGNAIIEIIKSRAKAA